MRPLSPWRDFNPAPVLPASPTGRPWWRGDPRGTRANRGPDTRGVGPVGPWGGAAACRGVRAAPSLLGKVHVLGADRLADVSRRPHGGRGNVAADGWPVPAHGC